METGDGFSYPRPPMRFVLALCLSSALFAQEPFAIPRPPLTGLYANMLRDELAFANDGARVVAKGTLSGRAAEFQLMATATGCTGKGTWGSERDLVSTGTFAGDSLELQVGNSTFLLRPEAALDPSLADLGAPEPDPARHWTIAVYLGGDNDLEPAAVADLLELQRGLPDSGCEVVVLLDRFRDEGEPESEWADTRVLRVTKGEVGSFTTIGEPKERDTSDASTLASFVTGVFRRFPAKHHAVIVWDHGGGFSGICVDEDAPGRVEGKRMLSLFDVRLGLATALQQSGVLRLDLLAFDACLMAQLEVALAMHDLAGAMVASEAEVPGTGYPYEKLLSAFDGDADGHEVARKIVASYGTFSDDAFESTSTLSAFDLGAAPRVAGALERVATAAQAVSDAQWRAIARALFYAENYETRDARTGDHAFASLDLLDFSERLRRIPGMPAAELDGLKAAVGEMVLARYSGAERTLSHGISIHGPHRSGQLRASYAATPLGKGSAWELLLRAVHAKADADQSDLAIGNFRMLEATGVAADSAQPFGGQRILFDATGNSIVEVQVHDWVHDDQLGLWVLLRKGLVKDPLWPARWAEAAAADAIDLVMPHFEEGKNELFHEIAGFGFAITDGSFQTRGTVDLSTPNMQAPFTAIARCTRKATGEQLVVEVSFDHAEWQAVGFQPLVSSVPGTLPRTLVPEAGDTFEFFLNARDDDGKEDAVPAPALTYGDAGLALVAEADAPGHYRAEMVARTLQGRTQRGSHEYTVRENFSLSAWPGSWKDFDPASMVGTFAQWKVVGPQQYQDLKMTCEVTATNVANVYRVLARGGPNGDDFETHQYWNFEWRSLPCLKVVTLVEDGQKFGWWGPARIDTQGGKLVLVMKAVNASGVVWEWRQQ